MFGLKTSGFHDFTGMDTSELPYMPRAEYIKLLKDSESVFEFWIRISQRLLGYQDSQLFGEKTPCNSIHFKEALLINSQLYCIHIYRNPYDVLASLVSRGKSPMQALALYLYNTVNALEAREMPNYIPVSYESLVTKPKEEVTRILDGLSHEFQDQMIRPTKDSGSAVTKIDGWKYDETGKIESGSINRFLNLDPSVKTRLISLIDRVKIYPEVSRFNSVKEIGQVLDYNFLDNLEINSEAARKEFEAHQKSYRFHQKVFKGNKYPFYFE